MPQIWEPSQESTSMILNYFRPCLGQDLNTYACYLQKLEDIFYPAPAKGYKARSMVLLVAFSFIFVIVLAQLILIEMERRRNRRPYWIFRFTKIESHRFLVSNQSLLTAYTILATDIVATAFVIGEWKQTLDHGDQWWRGFRRSSVCFPTLLGALLASFSLLQSFIVILGRNGRKWSKHTLRFTVAAFFICVFLYCAAFTTLTISAAKAFHRQWLLYLHLRQSLISSIPSWTSASNPELADVQLSQLISLRESSRLLWSLQTATKSLHMSVAALNLALACLSVGIWLIIRQQLERHASSIAALQNRDNLSSEDHAIDYAETLPANPWVTTRTPSLITSPTKSSCRSSDLLTNESAQTSLQIGELQDDVRFVESTKRTSELKRAGDWVVMLGGGIIVYSALIAGTIAWTLTLATIPFSNLMPQKGQAVKAELGNFLFVWVWTVTVLPLALINLIELYKHLPPKESAKRLHRSCSGGRDTEFSIGDPSRRVSSHSSPRHQDDSLEAFLRSLEPIAEVDVPNSTPKMSQTDQSTNPTIVVVTMNSEDTDPSHPKAH